VTRIIPEGATDLTQVVWLTVLIVLGMVAATAFSVSMSRRDAVLVLAKRLGDRERWSPATRRSLDIAAVLLVTPVLMVVWAAVLALLLAILLPEVRLDEVAPVSVAIVAATRVLAYVAPPVARVLADVVPLAFVVLLLTGFVGVTSEIGDEAEFRVTFDIDPIVIAGLVALELVLRGGRWWLDERRGGQG
jgi:hypothetical protein